MRRECACRADLVLRSASPKSSKMSASILASNQTSQPRRCACLEEACGARASASESFGGSGSPDAVRLPLHGIRRRVRRDVAVTTPARSRQATKPADNPRSEERVGRDQTSPPLLGSARDQNVVLDGGRAPCVELSAQPNRLVAPLHSTDFRTCPRALAPGCRGKVESSTRRPPYRSWQRFSSPLAGRRSEPSTRISDEANGQPDAHAARSLPG